MVRPVGRLRTYDRLPTHRSPDTDPEEQQPSLLSTSSSESSSDHPSSSPRRSLPRGVNLEELIRQNREECERILREGTEVGTSGILVMRTAEASARQEYMASRERMIFLERELQQRREMEAQQVRVFEQKLQQCKARAVAAEARAMAAEKRAVAAEDKVQQLEVTLLQELKNLLVSDGLAKLSSAGASTSMSETPSPSSGFFLLFRAQIWKLFNFFRRGFAEEVPSRLCDASVGLDVALHKEEQPSHENVLSRGIGEVNWKNLG